LIVLNVQLFQASDRLGELIQMVDRCEPRNSFLYHDLSQAFSRLVGIKIICSDKFKLIIGIPAIKAANSTWCDRKDITFLTGHQQRESPSVGQTWQMIATLQS